MIKTTPAPPNPKHPSRPPTLTKTIATIGSFYFSYTKQLFTRRADDEIEQRSSQYQHGCTDETNATTAHRPMIELVGNYEENLAVMTGPDQE